LVQNISYYSSLSEITDINTYRTIILCVGLHYGCETWVLTLREKQMLQVNIIMNRMLRIFGPKRDEVTKCWRRMHENLCWALLTKYYSSSSSVWPQELSPGFPHNRCLFCPQLLYPSKYYYNNQIKADDIDRAYDMYG
jgi:hypothetical protein